MNLFLHLNILTRYWILQFYYSINGASKVHLVRFIISASNFRLEVSSLNRLFCLDFPLATSSITIINYSFDLIIIVTCKKQQGSG